MIAARCSSFVISATSTSFPIEFIQEHLDPSTHEQIRLNGKLVGEMYRWLP